MTNPDRRCMKCGYDLTGLDVDGDCPECGTEILDSIESEPHRRFARLVTSGAGIALLPLLVGVAVGAWGSSHTNRIAAYHVLLLVCSACAMGMCACLIYLATDQETRAGRRPMILLGVATGVLTIVVELIFWFA